MKADVNTLPTQHYAFFHYASFSTYSIMDTRERLHCTNSVLLERSYYNGTAVLLVVPEMFVLVGDSRRQSASESVAYKYNLL